MPAVVAVGARAILDEHGTDSEVLAVFVALFAELDDGRRLETGPSHFHQAGPRHGLGAVWVRFDGDAAELPGFDRELAAHDPEEAFDRALESSYRVQPRDIEDSVRQRLDHGGPPVLWVEDASEQVIEQHRLVHERNADRLWENLAGRSGRKASTRRRRRCAPPHSGWSSIRRCSSSFADRSGS